MKEMFNSTHWKITKENHYKINPYSLLCNEVCNVCGDCVNNNHFPAGENYTMPEIIFSVWLNKLKHRIKHFFKKR